MSFGIYRTGWLSTGNTQSIVKQAAVAMLDSFRADVVKDVIRYHDGFDPIVISDLKNGLHHE